MALFPVVIFYPVWVIICLVGFFIVNQFKRNQATSTDIKEKVKSKPGIGRKLIVLLGILGCAPFYLVPLLDGRAYRMIPNVASMFNSIDGCRKQVECVAKIAANKSDPQVCHKSSSYDDCIAQFSFMVSESETCNLIRSDDHFLDAPSESNYMNCLKKFPNSTWTTELCLKSLESEDSERLTALACWNSLDPNQITPKTKRNVLVFYFLEELFDAAKAKSLIKKINDINHRDNEGNTVLFYARSFEAAKFLIEAGANLNEQNLKGMTPAMAWMESMDSLQNFDVEGLMTLGLDLKIKDKNGDNILHYVIRRANRRDSMGKMIQIATRLIKAGASPTDKNTNGRSPKDQAQRDFWKETFSAPF